MYGEGLNPLPYVIAAYAIGAAGIFGYGFWLAYHHKRILQYLALLKAKEPQE